MVTSLSMAIPRTPSCVRSQANKCCLSHKVYGSVVFQPFCGLGEPKRKSSFPKSCLVGTLTERTATANIELCASCSLPFSLERGGVVASSSKTCKGGGFGSRTYRIWENVVGFEIRLPFLVSENENPEFQSCRPKTMCAQNS